MDNNNNKEILLIGGGLLLLIILFVGHNFLAPISTAQTKLVASGNVDEALTTLQKLQGARGVTGGYVGTGYNSGGFPGTAIGSGNQTAYQSGNSGIIDNSSAAAAAIAAAQIAAAGQLGAGLGVLAGGGYYDDGYGSY